MARRLSDIIANGLRSLSISSCCSHQSDSESSQSTVGPDPGQGIPLQNQPPAPSPQLSAPPSQGSGGSLQLPVPSAQPSAGSNHSSQVVGSDSHGSRGSSGSRRQPHPVLQALADSIHSSERANSNASSDHPPSHSSAPGIPFWMSSEDALFVDEPSLAHLKYNKLQAIGAQRRRWIEDASEPGCPVQYSETTVTFSDLQERFGFPDPERMNIDPILARQVRELGLPNEFDVPNALSSSSSEADSQATIPDDVMSEASAGPPSAYMCFDGASGLADWLWIGFVGPSVITLDNVFRVPTSTFPRIAYVTKAIYEHCHPIDTLRHVFVTSIVNISTRRFCQEKLYTKANNLHWPAHDETPADHPPISWEHGSDEYDGLLGTQFGKIISYLVIAAYPRGTHRIARIVTWPIPLCIRFDIEEIPSS